MKTLILGLAVTLALTAFWLVAVTGAAAVEALRLGKSRRD